MCWVGYIKDRKCALEDITVYKILEETNNLGDDFTGLFSPVRGMKYEIGKTYTPNLRIKPFYNYVCDECSISIGLHCYSEDNKIIVSNDGDITVIGGSRYAAHGHTIIPIIVRCIIPKGTIYYINSSGEIVTEKLTLVCRMKAEYTTWSDYRRFKDLQIYKE
jgi:hypothetical protein